MNRLLALLLLATTVVACASPAPGVTVTLTVDGSSGFAPPDLRGVEVSLYRLHPAEHAELDAEGVTIAGASCQQLRVDYPDVTGECRVEQYWRPSDEPDLVAVTGGDGRVVVSFDPAAPYAVYARGPFATDDQGCDWSGGEQFSAGESRVTIELSVACA